MIWFNSIKILFLRNNISPIIYIHGPYEIIYPIQKLIKNFWGKYDQKSQKNWPKYFICYNNDALYTASNGIKISEKYKIYEEINGTFFTNWVLYAQSKKASGYTVGYFFRGCNFY